LLGSVTADVASVKEVKGAGRMDINEARRMRASSFFCSRMSFSAVLNEMRLSRIHVRSSRQASDERRAKERLKRNDRIIGHSL